MKTKLLKMADGVREVSQNEAFESVKNMLMNIAGKFYQYEFDDAFQIASMAFVRAWDNYNDINTKFSTYVYRSANINLIRQVQLDSGVTRKFKGAMISFDKVADQEDCKTPGKESLINMIDANVMNIDAIIDCIELKKMINALTKKEKDVLIRLCILNESGEEVAKRYGVTRSAINQIKHRIIKRMERALYGKVS